MNMFCFSCAFFHNNIFKNAKKKIRSLDDAVLSWKKKARAQMATQVEKRKAIKEVLGKLHNWINELHDELSAAKIAVKAARKEVKSQ